MAVQRCFTAVGQRVCPLLDCPSSDASQSGIIDSIFRLFLLCPWLSFLFCRGQWCLFLAVNLELCSVVRLCSSVRMPLSRSAYVWFFVQMINFAALSISLPHPYICTYT